jgi:hypothetical protein
MSSRSAGALVFYTSAAVLVLEILAGRLLAPYAGVTLETFTAIIGVVLAGIAVGTWVGGRWADHAVDAKTTLGPTLITGAAFAAISVPVVRLLGPTMGGEGVPGLVVLTAVSILPATATLSAVAPIIVKLTLEDLNRTGATVGRLSALGTTGALFGTFFSGFVLVAAFPTSMIIVGISLLTAVIGLGLSLAFRPRSFTSTFVSLTALVVGGWLATAVQSPCDVETAYFCASEVVDPDDPSASFLVLDTVTHAYVDQDDPTNLRFTSIRMFAAAIDAMTTGPVDAVHIGGGGFSVATWLTATRPGTRNTVLELDGHLVDFVEQRFDPPPVHALAIGDARLSLATAGSEFDVAIGDAFGGLAVPWHLTTAEFLGEISTSLADDGFYIMNLIDHGDLAFLRAEAATAATVFPHVAVVTLPERYETGGNFMIVASKRAIAADAIVEQASLLGLSVSVLIDQLEAFVDGAAALTDDFAPVDQLLSTR